ncbi:Aliphatic sulfonates import ATP-binding protein SsuB [Bremerella volcania]|uniref:Aliphatic sulfonates import ATP-binding protein SsuB n=1 Tax=Bremerella volcania TaxID=2527984 RepID=A0A518C3R5_9BACT|nr:ABC transporter ATP-binding protein [Bremerella volcania]QDU73867.1 Aliphatic sulfonates import ATP-binding protein SsuB [Bremerella volcania]
MSAIEFRQLEKRFSPESLVLSVDALEIPSGQFVSLVGPSGCGKSTLLRLVANLDQPSGGQLTLSDDQAGERAFVFQDASLIPWRTASENVQLPLELRRQLTRDDQHAIDAAIRMVGLQAEDSRKFPRMLSGGMRMRVSLARALVTQPRILLMDEPFAALDDLLRNQLNEQLLDLWREQKWTTLFVTHNVAEAVFLSQRVLVMHAQPGRIVADMTVPFDYPRRGPLRSDPDFARFCGEVMGKLAGAAA